MDSQKLQQSLDAAVLAVTAVQGHERHVDARLPQHHVDVPVDEQRPGVVATVGEGSHHGLAGADRDVPLGRQSPHEHTDLALSDHPPRVTLPRAGVKKTSSVVKTGAMTFLEAAFEVLRLEGKPLHYKELTERVIGKKLLTFVGRTPEVTMQTQLTAAVKKAPGNPFVRVKPGIFGLLRYPEVTAEERAAAAAKPEEPKRAARAERPEREEEAPAGAGRGRRRRGGRGRDEPRRPAPAAAAAGAAARTNEDGEAEEPAHGSGL